MIRIFSGQVGSREVLTTLPAWSAKDTGRFVYSVADAKFYAASDTQWVDLSTKTDAVATLPVHSAPADIGRLVYVIDEDKFYAGLASSWYDLSNKTTNVATLSEWTPADTGKIVYAIDVDKFYTATATAWVEIGTGTGGSGIDVIGMQVFN